MVRQPKEIKIDPVDFESPIEKGDTPVRRSEGGPPCGDDMHSLRTHNLPKGVFSKALRWVHMEDLLR